jgi:hypothetical protein
MDPLILICAAFVIIAVGAFVYFVLENDRKGH